MVDTAELKSCPFCGGEASNAMNCGDEFNEYPFSVECNECAAQVDCYSDNDSAVEAWNRRALEAPADRVEKLEAALREIEGICERLAATRSTMTYKYMLSDGQADDLLALDNARKAARALLTERASK